MLVRRFVALLLALSPCVPASAANVEWRARRPGAARDVVQMQQVVLAAHNRARVELGLAPLRWSPVLAEAATRHAQLLAQRGQLFHAPQPAGAAWQGENIFAGTRGGYDYGDMVRHWLAERRDFLNRPSPKFSRTGRWQDVVHYAQIVWRETTEIGCAMESGQTEDFLVCRYTPGGEVAGRRAY